MPQYPSLIDLAALDGLNGFALRGGDEDDGGGFSVSAGDFNRDGYTDLLMGAPLAGGGAAYVVFGAPGAGPAIINIANLDGSNGFALPALVNSQMGRSVSGAGDVNGDGIDDFILGAYAADPHGGNSGSSYVVFGRETPFPASFNLATLDGDNGFRLDGSAELYGAGFTVSQAGDVNGDGIGDIIVGAPFAHPGGDYSGAAYVVFGKDTRFAAHLNLANLSGVNGFKISGFADFDQTGFSVDGAGDVNGDGFDDVIVGTPYADPGTDREGLTYVIYGKAGGFHRNLDLAHFRKADGFTLTGEASRDYAGSSVSSAGDINGDGVGDLIVGAPSVGPSGTYIGAAYVVFGDAGGFGKNVNLANLNGHNGFQIHGIADPDRAGWSVSAAGDFNGDGFGDLIVGATGPGGYAGASYIVFGAKTGFAADFDLGDIDGNNGIKLAGGSPLDRSGTSVSAAGDVNGDGFADVIVGAWGADSYAGASYVVYGHGPGEAVTRIGSAISQTIHGGIFADTLSGLGGNDTLIGDRAADRLNGGAGADTLDGGKGADIFAFDAATESSGKNHDIVVGANFSANFFDVGGAVSGIDTAIATGTLSNAHFDANMSAAVDADALAANHAVLFTPDAGGLAGHVFLIVDRNGTAGYQKGGDLLLELTAAKQLSALGTEDFVS